MSLEIFSQIGLPLFTTGKSSSLVSDSQSSKLGVAKDDFVTLLLITGRPALWAPTELTLWAKEILAVFKFKYSKHSEISKIANLH